MSHERRCADHQGGLRQDKSDSKPVRHHWQWKRDEAQVRCAGTTVRSGKDEMEVRVRVRAG